MSRACMKDGCKENYEDDKGRETYRENEWKNKKIWMDDVEEDVQKIRIREWKGLADGREERKKLIEQANIFPKVSPNKEKEEKKK